MRRRGAGSDTATPPAAGGRQLGDTALVALRHNAGTGESGGELGGVVWGWELGFGVTTGGIWGHRGGLWGPQGGFGVLKRGSVGLN